MGGGGGGGTIISLFLARGEGGGQRRTCEVPFSEPPPALDSSHPHSHSSSVREGKFDE